MWQLVQHWHLKIDFSHDVVQTIDQQDGLVAVQNIALIRTRHVAPKRVPALGKIGNTEAAARRIKSIETRDDILKNSQCLGPVAIPVRARQERVVRHKVRMGGVGEDILYKG